MGLLDELEAEHADLPPCSDEVPPMPDWPDSDLASLEPPRCDCGAVCFPGPVEDEPLLSLTRSPELLADRFAMEWLAVQRATARMWRAAAAMHAATGARSAEFVGDDLALLTNTHPRSGSALLVTAVGVCEVPDLLALVESGQLSTKHALALMEEASRFADGDRAQQAELIRQTLVRCQARVDAGQGWPTPGQLRKRLQTVAVLNDLTAAEKRSKSVAERRGVSAWPTGVGSAALTVEGPQVQVAAMLDAIRARAEAMGKIPGDVRTLEQRMFDAAHELLTVDADGGESAVPAVGLDGEPVTIRVRGSQVSLVMPVSVGRAATSSSPRSPASVPSCPRPPASCWPRRSRSSASRSTPRPAG